MSDSDDDLLALAEVGVSDTEEHLSKPETYDSAAHPSPDSSSAVSSAQEFLNPYPLENKYKDAADRAELLKLPEIEREEILYERAQEVQRYEERKYLAQRRQRMARPADEDDAPSSKRQRGTTGVSSSTTKSLEALKSRREAQQRRAERREESDYEESENSDSDEDSDDRSRKSSKSRSRSRRDDDYNDDNAKSESDSDSDGYGRRGRRRYSESSESETDSKMNEPITLEEVNKLRWGKTLLAKYAQYPEFESRVCDCFVRVNIGVNRRREPVYRLCLVRKIVKRKPYTFLNRTVDEAIIAALGRSERTILFSICSDGLVTQPEFEYWTQQMKEAKLQLPTKRRAGLKYADIKKLTQRVLTSKEIDELVKRRSALNGVRGASAVLVKTDLVSQREEALARGDTALVSEIDRRLSRYTLNEKTSGNATGDATKSGNESTTKSNDKSGAGDASANGDEISAINDSMSVLQRVNERNRRANVETVRRAEIQHNQERRRAGTQAKADPFSRLRTTARIFYKADTESTADSGSEKPAEPVEPKSEKGESGRDNAKVSLAAMDDLIASLDIKLEIAI